MYYIVSNELYHHGIRGQKWGVRRFQNEDGSLTPRGEKRYGPEGTSSSKYKADAARQKGIDERKQSKEKYLENRTGINRKIHSKAYDLGSKKSQGKIIAGGILKTMGVLTLSTVAASVVSQKMTENGNYGGASAAGFALSAIGAAAAASIMSSHITASVQKGRGKI